MTCECDQPGWCERHKVDKPEVFWKLCRTRCDYFQMWEQGLGPGQNIGTVPVQPERRGLGDHVAAALSLMGITEALVTKWVGDACGCDARRQRLNRLGEWAMRVLRGAPAEDLEAMIKKG